MADFSAVLLYFLQTLPPALGAPADFLNPATSEYRIGRRHGADLSAYLKSLGAPAGQGPAAARR
jgi:hypothetical protein